MSLLQAFVPYFILTALTIIVLVVKPINELLGQFSIGFSFPETATGYGYINGGRNKLLTAGTIYTCQYVPVPFFHYWPCLLWQPWLDP